MEFGDIDDFEDTSVFDGFDDGENFATKEQYADENATNVILLHNARDTSFLVCLLIYCHNDFITVIFIM